MTKRLYAKYGGSKISGGANLSTVDETNSTGRYSLTLPNKHGRNFATWDARVTDPIEIWIDMDDRDDEIYASGYILSVNGQTKPMSISIDGYKSKAKRVPLGELEVDMTLDQGVVFDDVNIGDETLDVSNKDGEKPEFTEDQYNEAGVPRFLIISQTTDKDEEEKQATDDHITNMWHEGGDWSNTIARDNSNLLNRRNETTDNTNSFRLVLDMDIVSLNISSSKEISYIDVDLSAYIKINVLLPTDNWETMNIYYSKDGSALTHQFNSKSYTRGFYDAGIQIGKIRIDVGAGNESTFFDDVDGKWTGGAIIFDVPDAVLTTILTDFYTLAIDYAQLIIGFTNDQYETLNLHIRDTIPVDDITGNTITLVSTLNDYIDIAAPGIVDRDFTDYTLIITAGDNVDKEFTILSNTDTRFILQEELTEDLLTDVFTIYEKNDQLKFYRKHAGTIGEWPDVPPRVMLYGTNTVPILDWITNVDWNSISVNVGYDYILDFTHNTSDEVSAYHEFSSGQSSMEVEFWIYISETDSNLKLGFFGDTKSLPVCYVGFAADGNIDFIGSDDDLNIQAYTTGLHHIRIEAVQNSSCKLYYDGKLISVDTTTGQNRLIEKFFIIGSDPDGTLIILIKHLGFSIYGYLPWDNAYLPYYFENGILESDSWKIVKGIDEVFLSAANSIALSVNRNEPILIGVDRDYTTLDGDRLLTQLSSNMAYQSFTIHDSNSKPIVYTMSEDDLDPSYIEGTIVSVNGDVLEISNTAFYEEDFFEDWIIRSVIGDHIGSELTVASNDIRHITKFTMTTTPSASWVDDTVFLYNPKRTISKTLNQCMNAVQPIAESNIWGGVVVDYKNGTTDTIRARTGNNSGYPEKTTNGIEQIKLIRAKDIVTDGVAIDFGIRWANYYYAKHYSIDLDWTKFPDYIMHIGENWNYFLLTNDGVSWTEVRYTNQICRTVSNNQDGSNGGWKIKASFGGGKTDINDKLGHKLGDLHSEIDIEQSILPNIGEGGTVTRYSQIDGLPSSYPPTTHNIQGSKHSGSLDHSVLDNDEPEKHVLGTVSNEITGFPNRTDSTMSIVSTHTFRIEPAVTSFNFYSNNVLFSKSSPQDEDLSGYSKGDKIYIWFDTSGVLQSSLTPFTFMTGKAFVSIVYKDTTTSYQIGEERHKFMPGSTHYHLHETYGATHDWGLNITALDDGVINLTDGEFHDEDISFAITGASPYQNLLVLHRDASLHWVFNEETIALITDGTDVQYDNAGTLADAAIYVNYWVCGSNFERPIMVIMGQATYASKFDAFEEQFNDLNIEGLPTLEIALLYRITYRKNGNMEQVADFRKTASVGASAGAVSSHLGLSDINEGLYGDGGHSNLMNHVEFSGTPDADDDIDSYKLGTIWINTDNNDIYILTVNTDGAAVWNLLYIDNTAYDAGTWDTNLHAPTKNAVRDKFVTNDALISTNTAHLTNTDDPHESVDDEAYNATNWDGDTNEAPSKNAVRDKFVSNDAAIASNTTHRGLTNDPHSTVLNTDYGASWVNITAQAPSAGKAYNILNSMDVSISGLKTATTYLGTWTPGSGYPGSPSNGDYWIVDTEGDEGAITFNIGDWIVYNDTLSLWQKVGNLHAELEISVPPGASIQDAVAAIHSAGGGRIFLQPGTHLNGSPDIFPITISSSFPTIIYGAGDSSIIDAGDDSEVFRNSSTSSVKYSDFKIRCEDFTSVGTRCIYISGLSEGKTTIENITIVGDGTNGIGIAIDYNDVIIRNCNISDVANGIQIGISQLVTNIQINDNKIYDCGSHGISTITSSLELKDIFIKDNIIDNNGGWGFLTTTGLTSDTDFIISDNIFSNNVGGGLGLRVQDSIIANNLFIDNTDYGAKLEVADSCTINGNLFKGNDSDNAADRYVLHIGISSDVTVTGNSFVENNNAGTGDTIAINVTTGTGNTFVGNVFTGNDDNYSIPANNFILHDGVMDTSAGMSFKIDGVETISFLINGSESEFKLKDLNSADYGKQWVDGTWWNRDTSGLTGYKWLIGGGVEMELDNILGLKIGNAGVKITHFDNTALAVSATRVPTSQAVRDYVDAQLMIGTANAAWVPCVYQVDDNTAYYIRGFSSSIENVGSSDIKPSFKLPIPSNRGGLKLYVKAIDIDVSDGDANDEITSVRIFGKDHDTSDLLYSDPTVHIPNAGTEHWTDTFGPDDLSVYTNVSVQLNCESTTARELNIDSVRLQVYYDT